MSLRHAILGLLSIKPMSGYELKKVIDESVGHFWSTDQSQVYRTLADLVDGGLASRRTIVQEERPNMHVHSVTDRGLAELDSWLTAPLRMPPTRDPFLARLFFADRLPPERIRELLDARRRELSEELAALETLAVPAEAADLGQELRLATLDYGISVGRAEIAWLDSTQRRLERITP
ncbi:PadR family transcriptional regulator [Nocardia uniformis]|uniref:PadR family transcriptional regulator n=1 Tax=Nocardia uniformis TaxID=53432 RepID=A0A849C2L5_9NOCA|nr:PadR family transcriptional regulator [Nocardia uniformis]NNH69229.1 PadR family transcriptional regulator [Nocardia uniformis]